MPDLNDIRAVETWSGIESREPDGSTLTTPFFSAVDMGEGGSPTWFGVYYRLVNGELSHLQDFDSPEDARIKARRQARAFLVPYYDKIIL